MNTWNRHIHTGTQNVHNVHNAHRNPETQKHLRLLSSGTKVFITFELKGFFDMRKRERHNLSMLTFPSAPNHVRRPPQGLGELRKSTFFFEAKTQLSDFFFKSPKSSVHASSAWRHAHPAVTFSIRGFYCDISEWHVRSARAWTPAPMFAPN